MILGVKSLEAVGAIGRRLYCLEVKRFVHVLSGE